MVPERAPIRIVIVDDDALVRSGPATILGAETDLVVVATAADGATAITAVGEHDPDVVLMDVRMAGMDGIEATRRIVGASACRPRVLVVTTFENDGPLGELTDREAEILRLVATGRSNAEVVADLVVAVHTVKTHVAHDLAKLGVSDRTQAVVLAYETGFIKAGAGA